MSEEWRLHEDLQGDWRIRSGDGHHLATIVGGKEAAHLMFAAPKLLAALEAFDTAWKDGAIRGALEAGAVTIERAVWKKAREAIAEAKP